MLGGGDPEWDRLVQASQDQKNNVALDRAIADSCAELASFVANR
jgi:hypothetical protein